MQQTTQNAGFVRADQESTVWSDGWYGLELDEGGVPFRWSHSKVSFTLPAGSAGRKRFRMFIGDFHKQPGRMIRATINGESVGEVKVDWLWQHYSFPFESDGSPATIELEITPLDLKYVNEGDPREDFGVCVRECEVSADPDWQNNHPSEHPRWLILETTSKCNLRCIMCAITEGLVPPGHMAWETFEKMRPMFPTVKRADLYGHGETFLHKRFFDMLEELRQHDANVRVITNATLLTPEKAKRVVELGLDKFIVSFDGASKSLYEEIRVGATHEKVINNIRGLMEEKRAQGSVCPHLQFQYMGMKKSIHEFPDFIKLAADLGAERVSLVSLHEYPGVEGQALRHNRVYTRPFALEAKRLANGFGMSLDLPLHELGGDKAFDKEVAALFAVEPPMKEKYEDGSVNSDFLFAQRVPELDETLRKARQRAGEPIRDCYDPWNFMYVKQDGSVAPCCVTGQIMGNVLDTPAVDIWNGYRYWLFRDHYMGNNTPECQTCANRPFFE